MLACDVADSSQCWFSLEAVEKSMSSAYALTFAHGSYEIAACQCLPDLPLLLKLSLLTYLRRGRPGSRNSDLCIAADQLDSGGPAIQIPQKRCFQSHEGDNGNP